jgi:hypothetical protein
MEEEIMDKVQSVVAVAILVTFSTAGFIALGKHAGSEFKRGYDQRGVEDAQAAIKLGVAVWGSDPTGAPLFQWRRITCTPLGVTKELKPAVKK